MASGKSYRDELVGVFGHPVSENPTVVMLEAAFRSAGLNFRYLTIEVRPGDLADAVKGARAFNMKGFNLTIPHKVEVLKYLDSVAPDAALMGAVNTVHRQGEALRGENTDGKGFLTSLKIDAGLDPKGKKFLILGAGGAARAICVELALAGAAHIMIVNRDRDRGAALVSLLNDKTPTKAASMAWRGPIVLPEGTDVLVNATSIGLYPDIAAKPELDYDGIRPGMTVCDVIPNPPRTLFLSEAERRGARVLDGLGMLVNQGAIGYKIWTGLEAPVSVMTRALAQEFGQGA